MWAEVLQVWRSCQRRVNITHKEVSVKFCRPWLIIVPEQGPTDETLSWKRADEVWHWGQYGVEEKTVSEWLHLQSQNSLCDAALSIPDCLWFLLSSARAWVLRLSSNKPCLRRGLVSDPLKKRNERGGPFEAGWAIAEGWSKGSDCGPCCSSARFHHDWSVSLWPVCLHRKLCFLSCFYLASPAAWCWSEARSSCKTCVSGWASSQQLSRQSLPM